MISRIPPSSVNFMALPMMLMRVCLSRVGLNRLRDRAHILDVERQSLRLGAYLHERNDVRHNFMRRTRDVLHFHLARFDFGHVENVIGTHG